MSLRRLAAALVARGLRPRLRVGGQLPRPVGAALRATRARAAPPRRPRARPLRVVSFNIAYAIEIDRAIEVLRETEALRDPDVLALQEMDAPGTERIAKALGMNAVYFPSGVHPKHERDFGCAILSPWPLEEPRKLVLPHGARVSRPAALGASRPWSSAAAAADPRLLAAPAFAARHLGRLAQARSCGCSPRTRPRRTGPVVIAGDFNSHGKVEELERAGFAVADARTSATRRGCASWGSDWAASPTTTC